MKFIDLTGMTFNRLSVIGRSDKRSAAGVVWLCRCKCGTEVHANTLKLRNGQTKSCGCYRNEIVSQINKTHGMANKTPTYKTWKEMWQRCKNPNNEKWKWYGGRGILVCKRWESFENFLEDMGERPNGMTIDRIDNDGMYSPENCRWISQLEQTRRQKKNKLKDGAFDLLRKDRLSGMTYEALAKKYGICKSTAHRCCTYVTWS